MKLSLNWLREFVDFPDDVEAVTARLTLLGLEVESSDSCEVAFPGVLIGHVLDVRPHPDADRLRVCRVAVGSDELEIVCGAPNVRKDLRVPVATVGAVLPGDFRIKKTKIRGQVSAGMICSERELGLGEAHEGIMELPDGARVGRPFDELYGYRDHVIEIEVTPNRPDWLSHLGVARELAAHYGSQLRLPEAGSGVEPVEEDEGWRVRIDDAVGCPRFTARLLDGVTVGESPRWMQQRLRAIGQRPINAVVDASNYLLHEVGHPNHCFDRDKIAGRTIILRRAKTAERFTTLDDVQRELGDHHLLVADEKGGLALAGIMGGAHSEVDAKSRNLLLEVAVFDPRTIRRGRRSAGLSTDASYRFERGVDFAAAPWVSRRLATLIEQVAGGRAHPVLVEGRGEAPAPSARFFVRAPQVRRVLGVDMTPARMRSLLTPLGIEATESEREGVVGVEVVQPSFRHDLLEEIDAIEELARHHGYDRLPERDRVPMAVPAGREPTEGLLQRLRAGLAARGYHEVMGTSFQPEGDPRALGLGEGDPRRAAVRVLNPVVQGQADLRTSAVAEMARIVQRNRHRGLTDPLRLFQTARVYLPRSGHTLPEERSQLVLVWNGPALPLHPDQPPRPVDLHDVIGEVDALLTTLGVRARRQAAQGEPYHRVGSGVDWTSGDQTLATAGELAPAVRRALDVEEPVLVAELSLEALADAMPSERAFEPISAYPPVRRDLSLVVPTSVRWHEIQELVAAELGPILERCELFDVYEGRGLPAAMVALGVRLSLRSDRQTLEDARVDKLLAKLLDALERTHQIRLRATGGGDAGD